MENTKSPALKVTMSEEEYTFVDDSISKHNCGISEFNNFASINSIYFEMEEIVIQGDPICPIYHFRYADSQWIP